MLVMAVGNTHLLWPLKKVWMTPIIGSNHLGRSCEVVQAAWPCLKGDDQCVSPLPVLQAAPGRDEFSTCFWLRVFNDSSAEFRAFACR